MNSETRPASGTNRPAVAARLVTAAALVALAVIVLTGCGLRLETPAPSEPTPDAIETVRAAAVEDALAVQRMATALSTLGTEPALTEELQRIMTFTDEHVAALGGRYDSGLDDQSSPGPEVSTAPPSATPDDLVAALAAAATRARTAADQVDDGPMAALLTSIATAEHLSALRCAALRGQSAPEELTIAPPTFTEPPRGVEIPQLSAITEAEDAVGYAFEVAAARATGDPRQGLAGAAATHRDRGESWALVTSVAGTDRDPRRPAYVVPQSADPAVLARDLTSSYGSLISAATPSSRASLIALFTLSAIEEAAWGAPPTALPGLPPSG